MKSTQWTSRRTLLSLLLGASLASAPAHAGFWDTVSGWFGSDSSETQATEPAKTTSSSTSSSTASSTPSFGSETISAGLKDALRVGSETVVAQLGQKDGFNADQLIHIPLPQELQTVKKQLQPLGLDGMLDDLEVRLNRAAEQATPKAQSIFVNSISQMTLSDAMEIYNGQPDAATQYFKRTMSPELADAMKPVIADSLAQVGAIQLYDEIIAEYKSIPFVPDIKNDLSDYVVERGMDGIFHYLAEEEAAIRQDPVKQSTELLKQIFG